MSVIEDGIVAGTVRDHTGGGNEQTAAIRSTSRFGALRARLFLRLAIALVRRSVRGLHPANPCRVFVHSTLARCDEQTRDLPGRGILPCSPTAPLLYFREALWVIVVALMAVYVVARVGGYQPIHAATGRPISEWLQPWLW